MKHEVRGRCGELAEREGRGREVWGGFLKGLVVFVGVLFVGEREVRGRGRGRFDDVDAGCVGMFVGGDFWGGGRFEGGGGGVLKIVKSYYLLEENYLILNFKLLLL